MSRPDHSEIDGVSFDGIEALDALADWSDWMQLEAAAEHAPRVPGVYRVREGPAGPLVYVGMAGERAGSGVPKGLQGRLRVYSSGKALTSGLGEALADRAFADPAWLRARLAEAEAGHPMRARDWGRAAIERAAPHISWATRADKAAARALEQACIDRLRGVSLWNRRR